MLSVRRIFLQMVLLRIILAMEADGYQQWVKGSQSCPSAFSIVVGMNRYKRSCYIMFYNNYT